MKLNITDIIEKVEKTVGQHKMPYEKPWKILISTVLSQRTRDETTEKVSRALFSRYRTIEEISNADLRDLENILKPIGFYREKAKRIREIAKILVENYNGNVPENKEELMKLPGVGSKTANIVLSMGFHQNYIAVDTHVHRIFNRLGIVKTKYPEETEKELMKIVPEDYWIRINSVFVEFGKKICKPIGPKCSICPLLEQCEYGKNVVKK